MWKYLTKKTPCNIIECGVGWRLPEDHNLFTYEREKVVEGIVKGICKAFDIPYQPLPSCEELIKEEVKQAVEKAISENDAKWQSQLKTAKDKIALLELDQVSKLDWRTLLSIAFKKMWLFKRGGV